MKNCIGIDLGTTNSCFAIWKGDSVKILTDEFGNRTMPSCVYFGEKEILVGKTAKNSIITDPENTIYESKRLIGRSESDPLPINTPFKVKGNVYEIRGKKISPKEVARLILKKIKKLAEEGVGEEVDSCVITVPSYFNNKQRQETKEAGEEAGFQVLRIINEPTAASLCYGIDGKEDKNVIVVDSGGGTTDVTLLNISEGIFEVVATSGDTYLGGKDIDDLLINYFIDEINTKTAQKIEETPKVIRKLKKACEKLKMELSHTWDSKVIIECLYKGQDYVLNMTRVKFNRLVEPFIKRAIDILDDIFENSKGISRGDIDEVILVGGTTRILKLQDTINNYFKMKPHTEIDPDESIAYGAAVQAVILNPEQLENRSNLKDILLLDVCSLSLGIESDDGIMNFIIPRNTTIPVEKKGVFSTEMDYQDYVDINVYEGERKIVKFNNFLAKVSLMGIQRAERGVPRIEVAFRLDHNGVLTVIAKELKSTGGTRGGETEGTSAEQELEIKIDNTKENEHLIEEAERNFKMDLEMEKRILKRKELEDYCYSLIKNTEANKIVDDTDLEEKLIARLQETLGWLMEIETEKVSVEEYTSKMGYLEEIFVLDKPMEKYKGDEKGEFTTKISD